MKRTIAFLSLLALAFGLHAAGVQLGWDPSPTPGVVYRIYGSTNGAIGTNLAVASQRVDVGTNLVGTVTGLRAGKWFFVVTALVAEDLSLESPPSNRADATIYVSPIAGLRVITVVIP